MQALDHQQQPANKPVSVYTATRTQDSTPQAVVLLDQYKETNCQFIRFDSASDYSLAGVKTIRALPAGGWLLEGSKDSYWLPQLPMARTLDDRGHILKQGTAALDGFAMSDEGLKLALAPEPGQVIDLVLWTLNPQLVNELSELSPLETQQYFLWGSHTPSRQPADLYRHLIHGWVYENRASWPNHWRICSENDAHSLYVVFSGLQRATGKLIYSLFKQQLLLSVLHRQADDGGWYHGEWTNDHESHFRLHTSALHLLSDAYCEQADPTIAKALKHGLAFLAQRADRFDKGLWFLHDSLEMSEEAMNKSPFQWLPSNAFGKSSGNMLVLNTQWDSTVVFERASQLLNDPQWADDIAAANTTTLAVLRATPAEWLYKLAFGVIALSFIPSNTAAALPVWQRALKRIGWKYLIPRFHQLKCTYPRLVMPNGFLDRGLSLKGVSSAYQAINVMDIVRLQRRFPALPLRPWIDKALAFTYDSGMWEQWAENPKASYAYGFWAESLYHLCLLDDALIYRQKLAATMLRMAQFELGQAPSLLGANREAVEPVAALHSLNNLPPSILFADLSTMGRPEVLLVNSGDEDCGLALADLSDELEWRDHHGKVIDVKMPYALQPGRWLCGTKDGN